MKRILVALCLMHTLYAPIDSKQIPSLLEGKDNLIHVAVIGSGPAGVAASINPARQGYYHTVVFQGPKPLGALGDSKVVENWPARTKSSGAEIMTDYETQARGFKAHLVPLVVTEVDFSAWPYKLQLNDGTTVHAMTVICATGSTQAKLKVPGESTYWGKGIFSCGLCDGSFARNKNTVIVGDGDIAVQRALQLLPEAKSITILAPGPTMTAHKSMLDKIKGFDKIKILTNKQVTKICGDETSIALVELYDPTTKETTQYKTSSVFLSTGLTPNTTLFTDKLPLNTENGCIELIDPPSQKTSVEGVMAAGTVSDPTYRQVPTITGDATKASMDAMKYLSKWGFDSQRRDLGKDRLYQPPIIPHPSTKRLLTYAAFNKALKGKRPLLVELYAPGCTSCQKMEGPLTTITEQYKKFLDFYKVDKEQLYDLVEKYDLNLIPAFLFFRNGKLISRIEGETTIVLLQALIKKGLDPTTEPEAPQS